MKIYLNHSVFLFTLILTFLLPVSSQGSEVFENSVGHALIDLETGKIVSQKFQDKNYVLASVSKLFSTNFALEALGPEYRFKTSVYYDGEIKDGILNGKLYLVGEGAPYLTAQHFISLIQSIQKFGINSVNGSFIIDSTAIDSTARISNIGLEDQPDNPAIGGLNIEFNRFKLDSKLNKPIPEFSHLSFKAIDQSSNGLKYSFNQGAQPPYVWQQNTKERFKSFEELPAKDSDLFAGSYFKTFADLFGLKVPSPQFSKMPVNTKLITKHEGLPLERLVYLGLEYSNNLIAEILLQTACKRYFRRPVSLSSSGSCLREWLQQKYEAIKWKSTIFENGSGLTLGNKVSPGVMVNYLKEISQTFHGYRSYWSFLSINGHSGGLARRLRSPDLAYRIYGKTGSLYYVNNVAGYLIAKSGKRYAYAIFITDEEKRQKLNADNSSENNLLRLNHGRWYSAANMIQDDLLKTWVNTL